MMTAGSASDGGTQVTVTTAQGGRTALVGAWRLLSLRNVRPDGTVDYPLGPDAIGQIVYSANGRMSAQLMRAGQARFQADDAQQASDEEKLAVYAGFTGYFVRF